MHNKGRLTPFYRERQRGLPLHTQGNRTLKTWNASNWMERELSLSSIIIICKFLLSLT